MSQGCLNDISNVTSVFEHLSLSYQCYHGYITAVICTFGIISNILNIIILTRRGMVTPANRILTSLAVADLITMTVYLVYIVYFYIVSLPRFHFKHQEHWMYFVMISTLIIVTTHTIGTWLIVSLNVFWFIAVCFPLKANRFCNLKRANIAIISVTTLSIVSCIPYSFLYTVALGTNTENVSSYWVVPSEMANKNKMLTPISFWIYSVLSKLIPCIIIALLCTCVIISIRRARRNRNYLSQNSRQHKGTQNKTNWMIAAVVVLFVVTEFPQGVMAGISALDLHFFHSVYSYLGDIMDFLSIINSAINFILFCAMSRHFRKTFIEVFRFHFICI